MLRSLHLRAVIVLAGLQLIAATGALHATAADVHDTGAQDSVLLFADRTPIRVGAYSPFVEFQKSLQMQLVTCGATQAAAALKQEPTGLFGPESSRAVAAFLACRGVSKPAPAATTAKGALTSAVWQDVMGHAAVPGLSERVEALVLTFEATDFGQKPEWNFCQDSADRAAIAKPDWRGTPQCYNHSDQCSMLTWGPRGATAGQGREIQWVLANVLRRQPDAVQEAFAQEFENVKRFVRLRSPPPDSCDGSSALEHFMCAVWTDPDRRTRWDDALAHLGQLPLVRRIFRDVYAREEFDGYKIKAYYKLWDDLRLTPTETDYAFFVDRATHIGEPLESFPNGDLQHCLADQAGARTRNAAARRCLSLLHPHPDQPVDRRARDMTFYVEDYPAAQLSAAEQRDWREFSPLKAGLNFGLSDARPFPIEQTIQDAQPDILEPTASDAVTTAAEQACPLAIRRPIRSAPQP